VSRRRRPGRAEGTLLAGWLFADLLLALSVIFLGVVPGPKPKTKVAASTTTATPIPVGASGLDTEPVCLGQIDVRTGSGPDASVAWVGQKLQLANAVGRRVGFMLLSGGGPDGQRDAANFAAVLQGAAGTPIAAEMAFGEQLIPWGFDTTYNPGRAPGRISVRAFFFKQPGAPELNRGLPGCGDKDDAQT